MAIADPAAARPDPRPAPTAPPVASRSGPPRGAAEDVDLPRGWRNLFRVWPAISVGAMLLAPLVLSPAAWGRVVHDELGVLELLTVAYLVPVVGIMVWLATRRRGAGRPAPLPGPARLWFAGLAVAAFYFMGEEASWGQHLLGFEPPASVAANNLQGEFNLHNADAWYHDLLNEVPRTLAGVACVAGAGVLPWLVRDRRRRAHAPQRSWFWVVPTTALVFPGLLAWGWNLPEKIIDDAAWAAEGSWAYYALVAAADEAKEYLLALTLLLYGISVAVRYRRWSAVERDWGSRETRRRRSRRAAPSPRRTSAGNPCGAAAAASGPST